MANRKLPARKPPSVSAAPEPGLAQWSRQRTAVAAALFCGLALSPNLWRTERGFPVAPVAGFTLPAPLDLVFYFVMLAALVAVALSIKPARFTAAFLALFAIEAFTDQMRWQPWAYQGLWFLAALLLRPVDALRLCRLIVVCTYFWSGLQKLNSDFIEAVFPVMVQPLAGALPAVMGEWLRQGGWIAGTVETAIGVALLFPRTRRAALLAAIAMHLFILAALGPWGQSFNSVVWPWNLAMIAYLLILFPHETDSPRAILWQQPVLAKAALAIIGILPAASLVNLWDAYLSFALYSGVANVDFLRVSDVVAARLPAHIRPNLIPTATPGVQQLHLPNWSYAELNVPLNAEPRVYRAVARYLCQFERTPEGVQLFLYTRHRLLGRRPPVGYGCRDLR